MVLAPLRVFSLKRSPAGAFVEPFRLLNRNNMTEDNVKNISNDAHKTGSLYLSGVLFKIFDEHSRPF